ncbi:hypothetical protein KKH82_00360 [Patescibacteria group bacterium]|nr:hypothetical protein [Patescibacteria group bacterium]
MVSFNVDNFFSNSCLLNLEESSNVIKIVSSTPCGSVYLTVSREVPSTFSFRNSLMAVVYFFSIVDLVSPVRFSCVVIHPFLCRRIVAIPFSHSVVVTIF